MTIRWLSTALFCVTCALSASTMACNRAKDTAEVRKDVAAARQEANEEVTVARGTAAKETAEAQRSVAEETKDLSAVERKAAEKVTDANRDVAMARIEGEHKVAREKCLALAGDAQSACVTSADAEFEMAKTRIENAFN